LATVECTSFSLSILVLVVVVIVVGMFVNTVEIMGNGDDDTKNDVTCDGDKSLDDLDNVSCLGSTVKCPSGGRKECPDGVG